MGKVKIKDKEFDLEERDEAFALLLQAILDELRKANLNG